MVIRAIVAVVFFAACVVAMHRMFWMLEQCVPTSQEAIPKARARRWKAAVAAVVAGAWVGALGIVLAFDLSDWLRAAVFAGPIAVTVPVAVWVLLVY